MAKTNFDKKAKLHKFNIGNLVCVTNDFATVKSQNLQQMEGPFWNDWINDTNAKIKLNNKIKMFKISKLKIKKTVKVMETFHNQIILTLINQWTNNKGTCKIN